MKKVYHFFIFLLCGLSSYAQVDNNPYLTEYYTAENGSTLKDLKGHRLLTLKDTTYYIVDLQQHTSTAIPLGQLLGVAPYKVSNAQLTPSGAIFSVATEAGGLYEWRQGVLSLLDDRGFAVRTAGNYLAWVRSAPTPSTPSIVIRDSLYLKDLATQQVTLVEDSVASDIALSKEGMLLYDKVELNSTQITYAYQGGVKTIMTDGAGTPVNMERPKADNGKVLYTARSMAGTWLAFNDGTRVDTLAYLGEYEFPVIDDELSINGGYAAYVTRQDGEASAKSWTYVRDSIGNERLAFSEEGGRWDDYVQTSILGLSPNGDIMVRKDRLPTGMYYCPRVGNKRLITTSYDRVFFEEDTWFMSLRNVLYKMNPDTTLVMNVQPFDKSGFMGSSMQFSADDFIQHFSGPVSGPGQLGKVKISSQPRYGKLTVNGQVVYWERSNEITRDELNNMKYTPNPGIVGVDTLQWQGFNGVTYSYDTAVALHVYPVLDAQPLLRTLKTQYSTAGNPDTVLIVNYPPSRWHTEVKVLLDNTTLLPLTEKGAFVIDPAGLTPGVHQLQVSFSHPLDSISLTRSFTVTAPQPLMALSQQKMGPNGEEALHASPNPFDGQFTVAGLPAEGTFLLSLSDQQGRPVLIQRVVNQSRVVLTVDRNVGKGLYLLNIYDETTSQLVGTLKLLHL
ncbi:T9SS type A sorting domain-containing protein [Chitinophaga agrisoli]|uniref:T9SS type A sorting domain-containing protein n=1 Tax=Chitinophaga agrisoli TaxID=2607653 RepID=A0A5B2VMA1_9BACT|nr:T9SS type A sorting domain-containing protein [Chitinophaga agrisoli]KAA2239422.1 T9SS type A sorting domain-containing protein [Chitinophaga agrisoli]